MVAVLHSTAFTHTKAAGSPFTVTIPATTTGSTLVFLCAGGAVASATGFTKRSTYGGGAQDVSVSDIAASQGTTSVTVTLGGSGDNVSGVVVECGPGLTYVGSSNNGTGASVSSTSDYQIAPTSTVTASANSVLFGLWSVATTTTFSGQNQYRQVGPAGTVLGRGGNQPGTDTQFIWQAAVADVTAANSYPANLSTGNYEITSTWFQSGTNFCAQALYADTSGVPSTTFPNDIVKENSLPGTYTGNWFLGVSGTDSTIAGYCDKASYAVGDTVNFKVDSTSNTFHVEIYRLGFYGFETFGARNVLGNQAGYLAGTVASQATPTVDSTLGSTSCGWTTNASWTIPANAIPGVYYVVYRRTDVTTHAASGHFVVRGNTSGSAVVTIPSPTYQAYNCWGATTDNGTDLGTGTWTGRSLYQAGTDGGSTNFAHRAYAVSYDRPYATQSMRDMTYLMDSEHGWILFAEAQGYNLGYVDQIDLEGNTSLLNSATTVVMIGHNEYLSTNMYNAYQNALAAGANMYVQSSNTAGWRIRFAVGDTNHRTLICYKDSGTRDVSAGFTGTGYDPVTPTGSWRDALPTNGIANPDLRRENSLTGQLFTWSGPIGTVATIDFAHKGSPMWRNSASIQALTTGNTFSTVSNCIGYEVDCADGSAGQPANLVTTFAQSFTSSLGANANGTIYSSSVTKTIGFSLYRTSVGGLVFNGGNWRAFWDVSRRRGSSAATSGSVGLDFQNALLALLYDLDVKPQTLQSVQPGQDTSVTSPVTGAPSLTNDRVVIAQAYGLTTTSNSGFLAFF